MWLPAVRREASSPSSWLKGVRMRMCYFTREPNHNFKLTPWCRVLLEKIIVAYLVKKFPAPVEPQGSLPSPQKPIVGPCLEPTEFSSHTLILNFCKGNCNITLLSRLFLGLESGLFPSGFQTKILCTFLIIVMCTIWSAHPILLDSITLIIFGVKYKLWSSSCNFL
jgi:hypothetical protein